MRPDPKAVEEVVEILSTRWPKKPKADESRPNPELMLLQSALAAAHPPVEPMQAHEMGSLYSRLIDTVLPKEPQ